MAAPKTHRKPAAHRMKAHTRHRAEMPQAVPTDHKDIQPPVAVRKQEALVQPQVLLPAPGKKPVKTRRITARHILAGATIVFFAAIVLILNQMNHKTNTAPTIHGNNPAEVDTSTWTLYTNDVYNFTLKIPPAWKGYNVTTSAQQVDKGTKDEYIYNYFHFEYPKTLTDTDTGVVFFEVGVFSPANWDKVKSSWVLLSSRDNMIFGGRASSLDRAKGLGDRYKETATILTTFKLLPETVESTPAPE